MSLGFLIMSPWTLEFILVIFDVLETTTKLDNSPAIDWWIKIIRLITDEK